MDILTSITTDQLPGKPIAHAAEQIQVLSTVVQEMITLPSISPTASPADMQHWPISPLEMRQWTELLIALAGSNNFSSLGTATKSAVRDALGRFISFVGIHARSNPDTELLLLDLYESLTALSAPELQSCFLGINKSQLLRRLEQRMQSSLSSASPSVSPDEVKLFGRLATESLSESGLSPTQLGGSINAALGTLAQVARLAQTQSSLAPPTSDAYAALLQVDVPNQVFCQPGSLLRLSAVDVLNRTARMMAVTHQQSVPSEVLSALSANLPQLIFNDYFLGDRVEAARTYVELLYALC